MQNRFGLFIYLWHQHISPGTVSMLDLKLLLKRFQILGEIFEKLTPGWHVIGPVKATEATAKPSSEPSSKAEIAESVMRVMSVSTVIGMAVTVASVVMTISSVTSVASVASMASVIVTDLFGNLLGNLK